MVKGRRWKVSLDEWLGHEKIRSVGDAEDVARQMVDAMKAGTFSPLGPPGSAAARAPRPTSSQGHTFTSVAATYQDLVDADPERTKAYRANLKSTINILTGWRIPQRAETLGELPIGAVDNTLLQQFYKTRVTLGRSASNRNKVVQFLRAFSRWAVREGYLAIAWIAPDDPAVTVKRRKTAQRNRRLALPTYDAQGRVLVAGEYERLIAVAEPRLRDLCIAIYESGVRLAELTRLQWMTVDLPRGVWTIRDSKDPDGVKTRTLPISSALRAVLERRQVGPDGKRMEPEAYVFGNAVGERGGRITTAWETAVLKAHGVAVLRDRTTHGLTPEARAAYRAINLIPHDIRHEAASQWLEGGVPLPTISFLLGHTSLETTQIYLNVRPEGLAETMAAFDRARIAAAGKSGPQVAHAGRRRRNTVLKMVPKKGRKSQVGRELA
jgi:integrase/recombinase XerC